MVKNSLLLSFLSMLLLLLLFFFFLPVYATTTTTDDNDTTTPFRSFFIFPPPPPTNATEIIARPTFSPQITQDIHNATLTCANGYGDIHLVTFTDKANNTVDTWCKWNPWLEEGVRQYIGYYNKNIVIGQCPYDIGLNTFSITADENGIINATRWISISNDGSGQSVRFDLVFNK